MGPGFDDGEVERVVVGAVHRHFAPHVSASRGAALAVIPRPGALGRAVRGTRHLIEPTGLRAATVQHARSRLPAGLAPASANSCAARRIPEDCAHAASHCCARPGPRAGGRHYSPGRAGSPWASTWAIQHTQRAAASAARMGDDVSSVTERNRSILAQSTKVASILVSQRRQLSRRKERRRGPALRAPVSGRRGRRWLGSALRAPGWVPRCGAHSPRREGKALAFSSSGRGGSWASRGRPARRRAAWHRGGGVIARCQDGGWAGAGRLAVAGWPPCPSDRPRRLDLVR